MTATVEPQAKPAQSSEASLQRQFVNFMFFKTDRAFRREPAEVKEEAKRELVAIVNKYHGPMMVLPYSTVGLKPNTDFMLWRITYDVSLFQQMAADINKSILGSWLDIPVSYLSMTKHSQYVDEHVHEGQEGRRLRIVPGKKPFLFVYPFVKTRDWYLLPQSDRQRSQIPARKNQHDVLVRTRRPGLRRGLRIRCRRRVPRSRAGTARDRVIEVHRARHADVHVPADDDGGDSGLDRLGGAAPAIGRRISRESAAEGGRRSTGHFFVTFPPRDVSPAIAPSPIVSTALRAAITPD